MKIPTQLWYIQLASLIEDEVPLSKIKRLIKTTTASGDILALCLK